MQESAANTIIKDELSVRQTEQLVKKLTAPPSRSSRNRMGSPSIMPRRPPRNWAAVWAGAARIVTGRKKGRIELEYYGVEDLNQLLDALHALKTK